MGRTSRTPHPRGVATLRRWMALSGADRLLLAEALVRVAVARLMIVFVPFRRIARMASVGSADAAAADPATIERLRWAIRAVGRRVPFRVLCYEQALAARWMLRRRGCAATIYFGVRRDGATGLAAHAWVHSRGREVIGTEGVEGFTVVAVFPAEAADAPRS